VSNMFEFYIKDLGTDYLDGTGLSYIAHFWDSDWAIEDWISWTNYYGQRMVVEG